MAFKPHPKLPPDPSIRIFFIGLNILAPTAGDTCQAFVHNSSPQHSLLIETRRKRKGKPDVLMMRHSGPLAFTEADDTRTHGFLITTAGLAPADKGVRAYDETEPSTEGTRLFDSFRLSKILDVSPGKVDEFGGLPSVFIDHGIFYTADKVTVKAKLVKKGGAKEMTLTEVPTIIGANIYLDPTIKDHQVTLFWRQNGSEAHLDLKPSANFTYEIYIINEPLFELDTPAAPRHAEFEEYFKILPDVAMNEQWELEFLEDPPDRGSTRTPCMSILLNE